MRLLLSQQDDGQRLDVALARHFSDVRRTDLARFVRQGLIRVNGRRAAKGDRVASGDEVTVQGALPRKDFEPTPGDPSLVSVVHADADLVAVDKPAGLPSHPLRAEERATVVQSVLARFPEMRTVGRARREAGLVHRLDNDTSGLLLFARNEAAFEKLRSDLLGGRIDKEYLALVRGVPPLGPIDLPIANDPSDRRRVIVTQDRGRRATTTVSHVRSYGDYSLVTAKAPRATRHQVRVHLASLGHPLAGDVLYGGPTVPRLTRHFLHAHRIAMHHPRTGGFLELKVSLPPDLAVVLEGFGAGAGGSP